MNRLITAKGNERHIRTIGELKKENGRPVILRGMIQDITERKKAAAIGIRAYVMKPLVMVDLAKIIREVLDKG